MNTHPPTTLPSIETCTHGNCRYGFPQFKPLNPIEWRLNLAKVIARQDKSKHHDVFVKAVELLSLGTHEGIFRACEVAGEAYGYDLYVDKIGQVAIFQPCCR